MRIHDKVIIITGAASGIGKALAKRCSADGARAVVVADRDEVGANCVADEILSSGGDALAVRTDVSIESDVRSLVQRAVDCYHQVDVYCSNAGVFFGGGLDTSDEAWATSWSVNMMAHVYGARAVVPAMLARGQGYFVTTCSSLGLLTSPASAAYGATKHAAVSFSEWLAVTYGGRGLTVSTVCPQIVRTPMYSGAAKEENSRVPSVGARVLEPPEVAEAIVSGMLAERFLILPHEEVAVRMRERAADLDSWIVKTRELVQQS